MKPSRRLYNRIILSLSHHANELQKFILWAPVFTLIVGFVISYYLYSHLKERSDFIQESVFTQAAREELTKIDLLLTNSILKIQSYENNLEDRPADYKKDEPYLDQVLRHTLFQRMTIIKEEGPNRYKALLRINTPESALLPPSSNFLQTDIVKNMIRDLKETSGLLQTTVWEGNKSAYLSVILRSRSHHKIFFLFTTPLSTLFNQTLITDSGGIIVQAGNSNSWIIETNPDGTKKLSRYVPKPNNDTINIHFSNSLPQSNVNLSIDFRYSPMTTQYFSPENIATVLGILLTMAMSFLIYHLIHQNRMANRLIVSKTLDLEKTAHDLQQALNSKANFFGKISHEIRTPLNLILGMIDLCHEANTDKTVQNYLKTMHTSGEHLLSMLDDLIELAQAEKNEITFQERTIYMAQFLGDVVKLAGQDCKSKGLNIYLHLDKSVPASVITDPNRLRQILLNLLRNASKYTLKGHVILAVQATDSLISNRVKMKFEIKDSGIGIPSDNLNKVFDAFFQVENSKSFAEGGVGLGLSIVKDIVKKMHGNISVQSTPNKGSVFTVALEFNRPDRTNWYEIYKTFDPNKFTVILLSKDPLLQKSFSPLAFHSSIEEIIYIHEDFTKVMLHTDPKKNYWIVCDTETASIDIDLLAQTFGRPIFVLGQNKNHSSANPTNVTYVNNTPFLPYELLTANGFLSRSRHRKHLSNTETTTVSTRSELEKQLQHIPTVVPKDDLSIIVADDDLGNIELYKAYFSKSSWQVQYNYDGASAWECFEKKLPDLLILDVRMPNMDGFELLEKIRDYEKRRNIKPIPVILVTADLLDYTAKTAKSFDDVTLLAKPIKKKLLFDTIHNVSMNYR